METNGDAQADAVRDRIIAKAIALCDQGGHYLWAGKGQRPGEPGCTLTTPVLDSTQLANTQFCAATINNNVCAGRCLNPRMASVQPHVPRVWNTMTGDVLDFINANKNNPGAQVGWTGGLTPRVLSGYTHADDRWGEPMDYSSGTAVSLLGKVVWGEGCDATQHFDCHGFVCYVLRQVCGVNINPESVTAQSAANNSVGTLLKEGDSMMPGDVLCYKGHVAFARDRGTIYAATGSYRLVHAEGAATGLVYSEKRRGGHNRCVRVSSATLLGAAN